LDIETMSAWGELLGGVAGIIAALGVIGSLVFVGVQIKRNTAENHSRNASDFVGRHFELVAPIALDAEFARRWLRAGEAFDSLDEAEQLQFMNYEWRAITAWNHDFHLRRQGLIPDYQWNELEWLFRFIGQRQSTRRAWERFRPAYQPEFQAVMEQYLGAP